MAPIICKKRAINGRLCSYNPCHRSIRMTSLDIGIHIGGAVTALVLGGVVLTMPKGTPRHKLMGRIWVTLMVVVALGSFRIRGLGEAYGFSWIHILSVNTLIWMTFSIIMIRHGRRRAHFIAMIGCYIGILVAGIFTLDPDRRIGAFLFGG